jgi:hypothetical protein
MAGVFFDDADNLSVLTAVAHILAAHSTKWRTLRIVSSWPFLIHFRNIKHHLPILKQLYLGIHTEAGGAENRAWNRRKMLSGMMTYIYPVA